MGTDLCAAVTEALYCQELHGVVPDTEGAHETHEPGEMTELGDHHRRRLLLGASAERKIGRRSLSRLPALGALSLAPLAITPAVLRGSVGQGPVGSQGEPYHTPYSRHPPSTRKTDGMSTLVDPRRANRRSSRFSATFPAPESPDYLTWNGGFAGRRDPSPSIQWIVNIITKQKETRCGSRCTHCGSPLRRRPGLSQLNTLAIR